MNIEKIVKERTKKYPLSSQEDTPLNKKVVLVKLFNAFGSWNWYITEYEPEQKIAFGYVEWLVSDPICDEWGSFSITELSQYSFLWCPAIEVDLHFEEKIFWKIGVRQ